MSVAITDANVGAPRHRLEAMSHPLRVTLELDPDDEPPHGLMRVADQPDREFHGYVQLISALQAARDMHEPPGHGEDRSGR